MRSISWATILLPFLALATAAPADPPLATPVLLTEYFGPIRTEPTQLPEAESSVTSDGPSIGTYGTQGLHCHKSGFVASKADQLAPQDYCNRNHGVVIPNNYQLYASYAYSNFKIDFGYRNINGGNWVIDSAECHDFVYDIVGFCNSGHSTSRGGYKIVSKGRVDLDPNSI